MNFEPHILGTSGITELSTDYNHELYRMPSERQVSVELAYGFVFQVLLICRKLFYCYCFKGVSLEIFACILRRPIADITL